MSDTRRTGIAVAGLAAVLAARPVSNAIATRVFRGFVGRLNAGDYKPLLRMYADDATLVFPGRHSWGKTYRGKVEIEDFFRRFVDAGIKGEVLDVLIAGPPWDATIWVRFDDEARDADGKVIYENQAVIFAKASWGKIRWEQVYEDTQKVVALDGYLGAAVPA